MVPQPVSFQPSVATSTERKTCGSLKNRTGDRPSAFSAWFTMPSEASSVKKMP